MTSIIDIQTFLLITQGCFLDDVMLPIIHDDKFRLSLISFSLFMISRSYYEGKEMRNKKSNQAGLTTEVKPAIEFLYPALLFATSACIRVAIFRVNLILERGLLNGEWGLTVVKVSHHITLYCPRPTCSLKAS